MIKAFLIVYAASMALASPCDISNSIDITDGQRTGTTITYEGITYNNGEYYTEGGRERGCVCLKRICVRKCCQAGHGYNSKQRECVPVSAAFDPPVWDGNAPTRENFTALFHVLYGKITCSDEELRARLTQLADDYHVQKDGRLYTSDGEGESMYSPDKYCVDSFVRLANGSAETRVDALVCFTDQTEEGKDRLIYTIVAMLISCISILVTVAVYSWLPELRNLHGRVLVSYLLSFFAAFTLMTAMQLMLRADAATRLGCVVMSIIIYFFLLSAFFWMNVMCFDIWWTFSGRRGLSLERLSIRGRMVAYSLYAFGVPLLLTVVLASLEFSGGDHHLYPNLRKNGCFLDGHSRLLYLYGPILVLGVVNLVFFVFTTTKIMAIKRQTSVLKSTGSSKHDKHKGNKQRYILFLKLFIIMGVNWLLEVLSALYTQPQWFWLIVDMYNLLTGFVIFLVLICKKKIFALVKKRFYQVREVHTSRSQAGSSSRTTTSRDDVTMTFMKS